MSSELLRNIAAWGNTELMLPSSHLFFTTPAAAKAQNGECLFAVGRKGSGKTAIRRHITETAPTGTYVSALSFQDFPFEEFYKQSDSNSYTSYRYTAIWEYVIYCAILSAFRRNVKINSGLQEQIKKAFGKQDLTDLLPAVRSWTAGISLLQTIGANASAAKETTPERSWPEKIEIVQNAIRSGIDDSCYYVLIDDIDEGYQYSEDRGTQYNDLICGLFRATIRAKQFFIKIKADVRPVVFIRTDIFNGLVDNNRAGWREHCTDISWNRNLLQQTISHRIISGTTSHQDALGGLAAVTDIQLAVPGGSKGASNPAWAHVERLAQDRIRDYVMFFKFAAHEAIMGG